MAPLNCLDLKTGLKSAELRTVDKLVSSVDLIRTKQPRGVDNEMCAYSLRSLELSAFYL